jgi:hypothetical protein
MPAAKTKAELLLAIEKEYTALKDSVANLDAVASVQPGACGDWSVKDIFAHLAEWNTMLLHWYSEGKLGKNPPTPAPDLKWSQLPELNRRIHERWQHEKIDAVMASFESVHRQVFSLAESLPEEALFRPLLYPWMRKWPLARWIAANTSSHYLWARTLIRRWKKSRAAPLG